MSLDPAGDPLDVDALLDDPKTRIVVCCGSGGVGKTTTAAALGLRAAERGRTVVVLTIDPARRLAQSMGIDSLDKPGTTGATVAWAFRGGARWLLLPAAFLALLHAWPLARVLLAIRRGPDTHRRVRVPAAG